MVEYSLTGAGSTRSLALLRAQGLVSVCKCVSAVYLGRATKAWPRRRLPSRWMRRRRRLACCSPSDNGISSTGADYGNPALTVTGVETGALVEYNVDTAGWSTTYAPAAMDQIGAGPSDRRGGKRQSGHHVLLHPRYRDSRDPGDRRPGQRHGAHRARTRSPASTSTSPASRPCRGGVESFDGGST